MICKPSFVLLTVRKTCSSLCILQPILHHYSFSLSPSRQLNSKLVYLSRPYACCPIFHWNPDLQYLSFSSFAWTNGCPPKTMTQMHHQADVLLAIVVDVCAVCLVAPLDRLLTDTNSSHAHVHPHPAYDPNRLQISPCRKTWALYNEPLAGNETGRLTGKAAVQSENKQTGVVVYLNLRRESGRDKNVRGCKCYKIIKHEWWQMWIQWPSLWIDWYYNTKQMM